MNTLAKLNFVVAPERPNAYSAPTTESRQKKMIAGIVEQMNLVKGDMSSTPYTATIIKTTKDEGTGAVTKTQVEKRLRKWYWQDGKSFVFRVKYGNTVLKLDANKDAIRVSSLKELVATLELVQSAVKNGELDMQLAAAGVSKRKKA